MILIIAVLAIFFIDCMRSALVILPRAKHAQTAA
jgi:hypothetical protein